MLSAGGSLSAGGVEEGGRGREESVKSRMVTVAAFLTSFLLASASLTNLPAASGSFITALSNLTLEGEKEEDVWVGGGRFPRVREREEERRGRVEEWREREEEGEGGAREGERRREELIFLARKSVRAREVLVERLNLDDCDCDMVCDMVFCA